MYSVVEHDAAMSGKGRTMHVTNLGETPPILGGGKPSPPGEAVEKGKTVQPLLVGPSLVIVQQASTSYDLYTNPILHRQI